MGIGTGNCVEYVEKVDEKAKTVGETVGSTGVSDGD
jgi:hypothetical protein